MTLKAVGEESVAGKGIPHLEIAHLHPKMSTQVGGEEGHQLIVKMN